MGQLEKYGLYVLCLVVFLILGVTIWGAPAGVPAGSGNGGAAMRATPDAGQPNVRTPGGGLVGGAEREVGGRRGAPPVQADGAGASQDLSSLMGPSPDFGRRDTNRGGAVAKDAVLSNGRGAPVAADAGKSAEVKTPEETPSPVTEKVTEPAFRTYKVRKGDSFDRIAQRELGSSSRRIEIERLNPTADAMRLQIGQVLRLPGSGAASPEPSNKQTVGETLQRAGAYRTYTIVKGDSFERIAAVELGSSRRVDELKKLNPDVDPRRMQIGKKIKLPLQ